MILSKPAKLSGYYLCLASFLIMLCLFFISVPAIADWNSGVTIEDISTRISIDIINEGVQVSIDLRESALTQLYEKQKKGLNTLHQFALKAINIETEQNLEPIIKSSTTPENKTAFITVLLPFLKEKPQLIKIIPDFKLIEIAGDKYIITVSHQGLPVIDHGVLTSAEPLQLDWNDPWYSHFTNPTLQRGHSDPIMAFLYIEPQHIKSEIIVRVKELANWTNLKLRDKSMIYPDEFSAIKQKAAQFLLEKNRVTTGDIMSSAPIIDRVDYIRMGASDIQAYDPQQAQKQVSTLIGVSIIHSISEIPVKIQWHWELFNEDIQRVAIRAYDPAGLFDSYVTPTYPVFEWENMLSDIDLPALENKPIVKAVIIDSPHSTERYYALLALLGFIVLFIISYKYTRPALRKYTHSVLLIAALALTYNLIKTGKLNLKQARLTDQQAKPILNQLLWNIYQAFEATDEVSTYDQLSYSISGDLIETLYLQNRKSFLVQDGGQSKTDGIEIQRISQLPATLDTGYLFDCEWLVTGEVIHWGHQHRRDNVYHAIIKVLPIDSEWKITELESIGQQRVDE